MTPEQEARRNARLALEDREAMAKQARAELESTFDMVLEAISTLVLDASGEPATREEVTDSVDTLKNFLREVKAWRRLEYGD